MNVRFASHMRTGVSVLMALLCLSILAAAVYPWFFTYAQIVDGYRVESALLIGAPQLVIPLIMLPLLAVQLYGLANLRRTFAAAARGDWFATEAIDGFRRFAWSTVWMVPVNIVQKSATLAYVSWLDPAMKNVIAIDIGSGDIRSFVLAMLFLFVAQIFAVGRQIDEDARSIL
ncbi:MAG: hypothetical protein U0S50_16095 [Sphingopyxis sp.]|uniref:hypothetical protein n=1 Tax=Sphingopyxis sp. TaxID=1908224 RepID=UPI002AB9250F|nr:hypothetical protein [Sphingopyxis sp.]MDZ3833318.1 hypothetical protein [Sphingopyxis sp.]